MKKSAALLLPFLCLAGYAAGAQTMMQPPMNMQPGMMAPEAVPQSGYMQPPMAVAQPYCQPYTDSFTMGGEKRITHGTACLHPDGSWELHPTQAAMNYVNRGGAMFLVPAQPFATVVIGEGHPHHHHYDR